MSSLFAVFANCINAWAIDAYRLLDSPFIISTLVESGKLIGLAMALFGLAMAYPRTRRSSVALLRFVKRYSPKWVLPILTVAAFVPGQADELIVIAIVLIPILASAHKRVIFGRYLHYAWIG